MTSMRLRLKLQAIVFKHHIYTYGGSGYVKGLIDFSLDETYTYWEDAEDIGDTTETVDTMILLDRYIYPIPLKAISIIDGTVKGRLKYGIKCEATGAAKISYFIIKLKKLDLDGNESDLHTEHTVTVNVVTTDTAFVPYSFPYFFHVDNIKLKSIERLVLSVAIWGKSTVVGKRAYFRRYYAMNSSDQMVDIPIV